MYTYVCPVVCINIYFAPNVPKVWGLQSQPLGLLSLFQSNKTHPTPGHHLMFAWRADFRGMGNNNNNNDNNNNASR